MKRGDFVRLSKIGRAPGGAEPCPPQYFQSGIFADIMSLPLNHTMDGYLLECPQPRRAILLLRYVRNGVVRPGIFRSSMIRQIHHDIIETQNSLWKVQRVRPLRLIEERP